MSSDVAVPMANVRMGPREMAKLLRGGARLAGDGAEVVADGERYPIVDGVPVMLPSAASRREAIASRSTPSRGERFRRAVRHAVTGNPASLPNLERFTALVARRAHGARPKVLVVGGGILGFGMEAVVEDPRLDVLETDVYFGPRTQLICDVHNLPFEDGVFDAVVCQAVLEHVIEPTRAVAEMYRVLRDGGLLYSEVPFMQPVHEGATDFTRWSMTGHRALLRDFDEIESGAVAGPLSALAWSLRYTATTLAGDSRVLGGVMSVSARAATVVLERVDRRFRTAAAALDGASGTFFLGRRRPDPLSDTAILERHVGRNRLRAR